MEIVAGQELYTSLVAEKKEMVAMNARGFDSTRLCKLQRSQSARGILGAEIVKSMHGYGLRYDSGLQNFGIICHSSSIGGSFEAAKIYAKDWVAKDPTKRYVWYHE